MHVKFQLSPANVTQFMSTKHATYSSKVYVKYISRNEPDQQKT